MSAPSSLPPANNIKMRKYKDNDDSGEPIVQCVKSRRILIVGLTGSGKSSIIRTICNRDDKPEVSLSLESVTKNMTRYGNNLFIHPDNPNQQYVVDLFDTVGMGDEDVDVYTILSQIASEFPRHLSVIDKVVFAFKFDRLRAEMSAVLGTMYDFFKALGAKEENFVVCLTFCDMYNDAFIENFWQQMKQNKRLPMMENISGATYTAFPNLNECDDNEHLVKYLNRKTKQSKQRIFEDIIEKDVAPFYPYDRIKNMNEYQYADFKKAIEKAEKRNGWFGWLMKNQSTQTVIVLNQLRCPTDESAAAVQAGPTADRTMPPRASISAK